jgi:hypothetical protein
LVKLDKKLDEEIALNRKNSQENASLTHERDALKAERDTLSTNLVVLTNSLPQRAKEHVKELARGTLNALKLGGIPPIIIINEERYVMWPVGTNVQWPDLPLAESVLETLFGVDRSYDHNSKFFIHYTTRPNRAATKQYFVLSGRSDVTVLFRLSPK